MLEREMSQQQFLNGQNYQRIVGFLRQHYMSRLGTQSLPERLDNRIQNTAKHYMTEVFKAHGASAPVQSLNQEVVQETTTSLDNWIQKNMVVPPVPIKTKPVNTLPVGGPINKPTQPIQQTQQISSQATPQTQRPSRDFEDVFQSSHQNNILSPDFTYGDMNEEEDPIVLMKRVQKQREDEFRAMNPNNVVPQMEIKEVKETPSAPVRETPLPQDYIIPQEDVVKYKETEYNIFLTSSDRDWLRNKGENRYYFSVNFNPGNRTGYGLSPSVQQRFQNIQRIEFIKTLLPTEPLTTLVRTTQTSPSLITNTDRVINVLSLPFIGVRIAELNANGFSSNPYEDNSFAFVQYDSTWNSDISMSGANPAKSTVGYTGFIPKFLKCQRVYDPTPLTTLHKLTIRMERHDGELLNTDPDVLYIQRICLSSATTGIAGTNNSLYAQAGNEYIFVQTSTYFPFSAIMEGDHIHIQGFAAAASGSGSPVSSALLDFNDYINASAGHYIVAVAHVNGSGTIIDGVNSVGYANILILRSRFDDPKTGSVSRTGSYFGGSSGQENELEQRINDQPSTAANAGLINLSRQTHVVLRVITRDLDASSNIRPDNV
jgi:hypothetical protein